MNKTILQIILILIVPITSFSQNEMSKQDIYSYWIQNMSNRENSDNYKTRLYSLVVDFIDNLKISGIDTIGVFEEDYVGAYVIDSCLCGIIPWIAYVQWIDKGITFHQKITECCQFEPIQIENSILIQYYIINKSKIDNEIIMPIITGTSKNEKGELIFEMEMIDHTTHYTIYCDLNGQSRFTTFEEYELENEENIFYNDNVNSTINSWRKMIENQLKEIEN